MKIKIILSILTCLALDCASPSSLDVSQTASETQALHFSTPLTEQDSTPLGPQGDVYYVATFGDDGDDGSQGYPWASLQHAVDSVSAGDTILVLGGVYAGMRIERSGTSQAKITIRAAEGETVVIDHPGPNNRHASNIEVETWEGSGTVSYWIIQGFEVRNAPSWGIDIRGGEDGFSHHIVVRENKVHHNGLTSGRTGIFAAFANDVVIESNESYNNGEHGVYVNNSSDRFVVRGNSLHDNAAAGLHLNGDESQGGDGIMSDGLIENNVIYENGEEGGAGINMDGVDNSIVRNNLLYANHASGIAIYQQDGAHCSSNNHLLHNTILMPADGRWGVTLGSFTNDQARCTGNEIVNNIIYSAHSYRGSLNLVASDQVPDLHSDFNVVVDRFSDDDGDTVISLAAWQALGHDAHSFIAAPSDLFMDASAHDYQLKENSPAIDAGALRPDVAIDLNGDPRPSGDGYDIGAYEFQSGAIEPTHILYLPLVIASIPLLPDALKGPASSS